MPSILDAVRAAIQSCFSRHLLAFLLFIVYDYSMAIDLTESSTPIDPEAPLKDIVDYIDSERFGKDSADEIPAHDSQCTIPDCKWCEKRRNDNNPAILQQ